MSESAMSLLIPGYELREEIGRGGMGVVYRARDLGFERDVAVKVLGEKVDADSFAAARFRNEARITGQLQHPGIPAAHELGTLEDGKPFLVMKLVRGATLQAMLDQRSSPSDERGKFIAIFEQICHAVGYAHAHNVIHRDLKPSNVMVGKFGEVQIMDWGLAKVLGTHRAEEETEIDAHATTALLSSAIETPASGDSATRTGSVLGTPAYMSPEQASGQIRLLDARSDVFGLGAILCEILTGRPPYLAKDANEVRIKAVRGDLQEVLERLDARSAEPDLITLAKRCLEFKQENRPSNGQAVADEVGRIRTEAESRARAAERERNEALVREAESKKRRRLFFIAASAVGAVLLLGIAGTSLGLFKARASAFAEREAKEQAQRSETAERTAKELAKKKQQEAETEWSRAEQREKGAIDAMRLFGDAVAEDVDLRNSEQLQPLRMKLLQQAQAFFRSLRDQLESERGTRPDSLERLALAAFDLGQLMRELGDWEGALRVHRESLEIREKLAVHHGDDHKYQHNLAASYNNVGLILNEMGKHAEALTALKQAMFIQERLVLEDPTVVRHRRNLALNIHSAGDLYLKISELTLALRAYEKAKTIQEELVREKSSEVEFQRDLANTYEQIGKSLKQVGEAKMALSASEQSKAIYELLARDNPNDLHLQSELAGALHFIATLHAEADRVTDALKAHEQAKVIHERLVRERPGDSAYRRNLSISCMMLGSLLHQSGRRTDALGAYYQARDMQRRLFHDYPNRPSNPTVLANTLGRIGNLLRELGNLKEASAAFDESKLILERLVLGHPTIPEYQHSLSGALNNQASLKLMAKDYDGAKTLLREAVEREKFALRKSPLHQTYNEFLKNHYVNLGAAAKGLRDAQLEAEAQRGLRELAASNARFGDLERSVSAANDESAIDAPKLLELAQWAYYTHRFTRAAELSKRALERDATLVPSRESKHGYAAASYAVLAASGESETDASLDERAQKSLRAEAMIWLNGEIEQWRKYLEREATPEASRVVAATFQCWLEDPDLASIHEPDKLSGLPEAERKEWEGVWARVKEMLENVTSQEKTPDAK